MTSAAPTNPPASAPGTSSRVFLAATHAPALTCAPYPSIADQIGGFRLNRAVPEPGWTSAQRDAFTAGLRQELADHGTAKPPAAGQADS